MTAAVAAGLLPSSITSSLAGAALDALAAWVADGAAWFVGQVAGALASTTGLSLRAAWFGAVLAKVAALAAPLALATLVVAAGRAVLRRRLDELGRALLVSLPLAALTSVGAAELTQLALDATDAASASLMGGRHGSVVRGLGDLLGSLGAGMGLPSMVHFALAGVCAVGALLLWVELLVRNAGVATAVLFTPLVVAASIWPALAHWPRRLAETLAALVLSKLVVAGVLTLAFAALRAGRGPAATLLGGSLLLLSAMAPFTLLRLVPIAEGGAAMALEGARRHATAPMGVAARMGSSALLSSWGTALGTEQALASVGQEAEAYLGVPMHPGGGPMPDLGGDAAKQPAPPRGPGAAATARTGATPPASTTPPAPTTPAQATAPPAPPPTSSPPASGPAAAQPDSPMASSPIGTNGAYEIGRDRLGPVLRWVGERG